MQVLESRQVVREVSSPEGTLTIVADVSFGVERGESLAIVGPSGSGKSTLLAMLAGLDLPTRGTVLLNGVDLSTLDEDGRARLRAGHVGFVFQSFHLVPALTALENVMLPLELAGSERATERAREALERVGLAPRARHYPRQLSGGEQQRVAIARALVARPDVLFADEPTGNLDSQSASQFWSLLEQAAMVTHTTVVMVTHEPVAAQHADRVVVLRDGLVSGEFVVEEFEDPGRLAAHYQAIAS